MKTKAVFRSGDEEHTGVSCYNCGTKFSSSLRGNEKIGDFIICSCGCRGAYLTGYISPELPDDFSEQIEELKKIGKREKR